jgi:signal transduction histidine kinase
LTRIVRTILRTGRDSDAWPVVLLLLAVLVPAVCLLWFMAAAMRNERLAARQKLADAYRVQLSSTQIRLTEYWRETEAELERCLPSNPAPVAFVKCVQSGLVDSVLIFDAEGRVLYPNVPSAVRSDFGELELKWQEASRLEERRDYLEAAARFNGLAQASTNQHSAARAFQAEARCRVQAGQNDAVIRLVTEVLGSERYRHAADPQGRLIAANAELMVLELITNRSSPAFQAIARRLAERLTDYENPVLASPQRRFLMGELQKLSPEGMNFPTLPAERLAAEMDRRPENTAPGSALQRGVRPGLWQFATPSRRVLALLESDKLLAAMKRVTNPDPSLAGVNVTLVPPDSDTADAFVAVPAGESMPGWQLALSIQDREFLQATAGRQTAVYLWTGILVVAGMGALAVIAVRLVRRQMTLARLKNDLAATVSHELKTPLSSMRVLVETLLDGERFDDQKTREYLQLIAGENERLGRLIQNFLTFSRIEQKKYPLHFSLARPRKIIEAAIQSARGRFDTPGCRLDVQVEDNIPPITADPDALVAALINLLENAYKYSEEIKHITLGARTENGRVMFSVKDNGIGISPRDQGRIFQPFCQVDERLSRNGSGCGLGLSIVQFIAVAHRGKVSVESRPGCGSVFTISLPVASNAAAAIQEAIA